MSTAVTETRVARSSDRILALPERVNRRPLGPYAAVMALGALIILAGLGHSSLFIDETFSWNASNNGIQGIVDAVQQAEVTPPLYYVILHGWIGLTGAESEWALRLPSALAGIALIGAVAWLATLVADRRAGILAGLLDRAQPARPPVRAGGARLRLRDARGDGHRGRRGATDPGARSGAAGSRSPWAARWCRCSCTTRPCSCCSR